MSKILTRSVFYYGLRITNENCGFDFSEGGSEISARLNNGDYTLETLKSEILRMLNEQGNNSYSINIDRDTRIIEILSDGDFELLISSGSQSLKSCWATIGFVYGSDLVGSDAYSGSVGAGKEYITQYPLKNYLSERDYRVKEDATFNVTPVGIGQSVSFGNGARIRMNITLITNIIDLKNKNFYSNPSGIEDFLDFIDYCMDKSVVEFMENVDDRNYTSKVFLETTAQDRDAFTFTLTTLAKDFYESGLLIFRKVLV